MTQREHAESGAGTSQCAAILAYLKAAGRAWVAMPVLAKASGAFAVHSRVAELRKRGHRIKHRNDLDGRRSGRSTGWWRGRRE